MAQVGRLSVGIDADTSGLSTGLAKAKGEVGAFEGRIGGLNSALSGLTASFATLAASIGVAGIAGKLVAVQREFDVLNASLITMTGSSAAAEKEFSWIKQFASETPFALNEVVGAFVKMKALGLDPTRESLMSFGNTASAMGKSLSDFIEAVADASTGEFERLKEFGIKSSQQGEQVSLTFRGVTTTIGKSADEVVGYLEKIGNTDFAGAATQRAKTLDGALSNLGDTWDELFRTVNNNATGTVIYDSVKLATGAIERAIIIIEAMGNASSKTAQQSGAMAVVLDAISTVFETVAALGVNVAYVLEMTGRELGGLAAQAAAVARLDFSGAATIGQEMKADAAAAREEVDRLTQSILNARSAAAGQTPAKPAARPRKPSPRKPSDSATKGVAQKGDPLADWITKQEEADSAYWAGRIAKIQEGLLTEQELMVYKYEQDLARLDAAMISEQERLAAKEALTLEHLDRMAAMDEEAKAAQLEREEGLARLIEQSREKHLTNLEKFNAMSWEDQAMSVAGALTSQLTSVKTNSRAMFEVQKAAGIAQAIMDTYAGAARALKDYPAPWSYAVAAATTVAGLARVAAIRSQTFGGATAAAGGGGGVSASAVGGVSATTGMAPATNQNIVIQGIGAGDLFSGDAVRGLIDKLNDAQRNGARVVVA